MKLQSKRQVNAEVQNERKSQIDEGMTLAHKVDAIRGTYGDEQRQLEDFRTTAVAEMRETEKSHRLRKEGMEAEIAVLLEARARAIEPLNLEWDKVEGVIATLQTQTEQLIEEKNATDARATALDKGEAELKIRERRISQNERGYRIRSEALTARESVLKKGEAETENRRLSTEFAIDQSYRKLDRRAAEIAEKQLNVGFREAYLEEREKKLINRETKLASDQEALIAAKEYIDQQHVTTTG